MRPEALELVDQRLAVAAEVARPVQPEVGVELGGVVAERREAKRSTRRRDAHAVVASRIWAASVEAEAAEVARARREDLEERVRNEKPAAPKIDWKALEAAASARGDLLAGCAICLGPFSGFEDGSTMLLDCAHAFHASCLAALERHLGVENRRCALCRKTGYATHVTKRAARDRRAARAVPRASSKPSCEREGRTRAIVRAARRARDGRAAPAASASHHAPGGPSPLAASLPPAPQLPGVQRFQQLLAGLFGVSK